MAVSEKVFNLEGSKGIKAAGYASILDAAVEITKAYAASERN